MLIIGHRGAMGHEPENTISSIIKAIELGADWVEIDVHYINDNLLVIHDKTLERTTNGHGNIADHTHAELRKLDAGKGQKIPTLNEIIEVTKNKVVLNIELKGRGTASAVLDCLSGLSLKQKNRVIVSSFWKAELEKLFLLDNTIKLAVLVNKTARIKASMALAEKINAYSLHIAKKVVTASVVAKAHDKGLKLFVYTVNTNKAIKAMRELKVDGVFSNFPERVLLP